MPSNELTKFRLSLQRIDSTRARMEKLYGKGQINENDMDSVYEALFLRAVTGFEVFLEELFLSILEGRAQYKAGRRVNLRMTVTSRDALMEILLQGDKYMTWLPFGRTEDRAKIYLTGGRPFSELDDGNRSTMQTIVTIRHAIAHRSTHAMNDFKVKVIGSRSLLPRERRPAGFLRSQVQPGTKRFEVYVGQLGNIASTLC
jgi:hypothetical protein